MTYESRRDPCTMPVATQRDTLVCEKVGRNFAFIPRHNINLSTKKDEKRVLFKPSVTLVSGPSDPPCSAGRSCFGCAVWFH